MTENSARREDSLERENERHATKTTIHPSIHQAKMHGSTQEREEGEEEEEAEREWKKKETHQGL